MDKEEIIRRLKKISEHAVHVTGEPPFIMSLDDGIALGEAVRLLKEQEAIESIDFGDKTEIMANLEGLTWDDWRMYHSDTEVQNIAKSAFDLLIALLKEQEPMKVKTDMYGNAYCPWCSTDRTIEMGAQRLHLGTQFCPYCGKAVKWND